MAAAEESGHPAEAADDQNVLTPLEVAVEQSGTASTHQLDPDRHPFQQTARHNSLGVLLAGTPRSGKSTLMRQFGLMANHDFTADQRRYARTVIHNNLVMALKTIVQLAEAHGYTKLLSAGYRRRCAELMLLNDAKLLDKSTGGVLVVAIWKEIAPLLDNQFTDLLEQTTLFSMNAVGKLLDEAKRIADREYEPTVRDMMLMRHRDFLKDDQMGRVHAIGAADLWITRKDMITEPVQLVLYLVSLADLCQERRTETQLDEIVELIKEECLQLSRHPLTEKAHFIIVFTKPECFGGEQQLTEEQVWARLSWRLGDMTAPLEAQRGSLFTHVAVCNVTSTMEVFQLLCAMKASMAQQSGEPLPASCIGLELVRLTKPLLCGHCDTNLAILECEDCSCSFCSSCSSQVHRGRLKSHTLNNFSPLREHWPLPCRVHKGQYQTFISQQDAKVGCAHCFLAGGVLAGHVFEELGTVWGEVEHKYQYILDQKPMLSKEIDQRIGLVLELRSAHQAAAQAIEDQFEATSLLLSQKKAEQLELLDLVCMHRRKQAELEIDQMQHSLALVNKDVQQLPRLNEAKAYVSGAQQAGSAPEKVEFCSLGAVRQFQHLRDPCSQQPGHGASLLQLPHKLDITQLQLALKDLMLEADPPLPQQLLEGKAKLNQMQQMAPDTSTTASHTEADTAAEYEYCYQLQLATEFDFTQLDYLAVARVCGQDFEGNQVIKLHGVQLQAAEAAMIVRYLLRTLDALVRRPYVVVVIQPQLLLDQMDMSALRSCAKILPAEYNSNLRQILVVEASARFRMGLRLQYPFMSSEVWESITYVKSIDEMQSYLDVSQLGIG